jgi:hypothetical protein
MISRYFRGVFPGCELSDQSGKRWKLSELQGERPMVLGSRGGSRPKDRQELHSGAISADNIPEANGYRIGVGAYWPFFSLPGADIIR